jgi:folylpolyglutamate synthase/dihydropteroate synthase
VRERIRVNDALISKKDFVRLWAKVHAALEEAENNGREREREEGGGKGEGEGEGEGEEGKEKEKQEEEGKGGNGSSSTTTTTTTTNTGAADGKKDDELDASTSFPPPPPPLTPLLSSTSSWAMFFDKVLALALAYFIEQRVEYIILEVGIGGRYDPTNFISHPSVCVITSVSVDHVELLGTTLEEIAWQKAGIMKEDAVCLTAATQPEVVKKVLEAEAEKVGCHLDIVGITSGERDPERERERERHTHTTPTHIRGVHIYPENFALAKSVLKMLLLSSSSSNNSSGGRGLGLLRGGRNKTILMRRGWEAKAFWPGRFEVFSFPLSSVAAGRYFVYIHTHT